MKKAVITLFLFLYSFSYSQTLKAGISEDYVPEGFFGSWAVISKLINTTNPSMFNLQSRDIWALSGYNNILILENFENGACSRIEIDEKNKNDTLKFKRTKTVKEGENKVIYTETVKFILSGNNFSGSDDYVVEKYRNGKLIKKDSANYQVEGVKISGDSPK